MPMPFADALSGRRNHSCTSAAAPLPPTSGAAALLSFDKMFSACPTLIDARTWRTGGQIALCDFLGSQYCPQVVSRLRALSASIGARPAPMSKTV